MYRVSKRSLSVLILIGIMVLGVGFYVVRLLLYGGTWVSAPFNRTVYSYGVLDIGTVTDRNGIVLADITDGRRTFAEGRETRMATLHAVGDRDGNVGTGALVAYASELMGYNIVTGVYSHTENQGKAIELTIDAQLNVEAYRALDGRRGAVMVSNYMTGEVLCMVSNPTFDPADPPAAVDDETGVYLNRAIQSSFTPGSIYKLVTAAAAIENISDIYEREFECTGGFEAGSDTVTCPGVHGKLDIARGLSVSCNVVFGQLAIELGADTLASYAKKFDLSESSKVGGITTIKGNFEKAEPGTADLAWSGVGQYMNMVCPATMLRFVGAIANDGVAVELKLLQETGVSEILPNSSSRLLSQESAQQLGELMEVNNPGGFPAGTPLHAKSGTAQVGGDKEPHAWYVGYIADSEHPYAFVVVVENGGGGTAVAAPIAGRVIYKLIVNS